MFVSKTCRFRFGAVLLCAGYWYFFYGDASASLGDLDQQYHTLETEWAEKQAYVDNLAKYEAQGLVVRFPPDIPGLPGRIFYIIQTNQNIQKLKVEGIDGKIASMLGTTEKEILVNDLAVNPASGKAYVALQTDTVAVIDTATDAVLKRIHVPLATYYMGVDESRNRIYAGSNSSAMIYVIDGLTDLVVDSIPIGGGFGGSQFAVDPANNRILVPTQICVISPGPPPVCSDV